MAWLWLALPWRRHKKLKTVIFPFSLFLCDFSFWAAWAAGPKKNLLWHRLSYRQRQRQRQRSSLADKDNTQRMWFHPIRHPLPLPQPHHRYHPHQQHHLACNVVVVVVVWVVVSSIYRSWLLRSIWFQFQFQFHSKLLLLLLLLFFVRILFEM